MRTTLRINSLLFSKPSILYFPHLFVDHSSVFWPVLTKGFPVLKVVSGRERTTDQCFPLFPKEAGRLSSRGFSSFLRRLGGSLPTLGYMPPYVPWVGTLLGYMPPYVPWVVHPGLYASLCTISRCTSLPVYQPPCVPSRTTRLATRASSTSVREVEGERHNEAQGGLSSPENKPLSQGKPASKGKETRYRESSCTRRARMS